MPTAVDDWQPLAPDEVLKQGNKQRLRVTARFFGMLGIGFAAWYLGAYWVLAYWMRLSFRVTLLESLEGGAVFSGASAVIYLLLSRAIG